MIWNDIFTRNEELLDKIDDYICKEEFENGKTIYPDDVDTYKALEFCEPFGIKVVILGQDPYHNGVANGLAFSVNPDVKKFPPSLKNIFTELVADIECEYPKSGDLTPWAKRGVLLLNTCLTVEAGKPMSHAKLGWQKFTGDIIKSLCGIDNPPVFILWGKKAQIVFEYYSKGYEVPFIRSPHPSPFSAGSGFFGSKPFSKANAILKKNNMTEIDWSLSE